MERVNEREREVRHGDHGPKYIFRGPRHEWGIIVLKPGGELGAHKHQQVEETFFFLEGSAQMIVDDQSFRAEPGDAFRIEPGEAHNIVNDGNEPVKLIFIKCPYIPDDKIAL